MNKENENISFFLQAAEQYGVPRHNLFQTVDLAEGQNLSQVQTGLYNVSYVSWENIIFWKIAKIFNLIFGDI